jgi:hypothetical protein
MALVNCKDCGVDNLDSVSTCRKCFKLLVAVVDNSAPVSDSPIPEIPVPSELPLRLVRCSDCGQAISRSAYKCVYCGKWSLRIPRIIPISGLFLLICWIGIEGYRSVVNHSQFGDSLISSSSCFEKYGGCTFDDRKWVASVFDKGFDAKRGGALETSITADGVNNETLYIKTSGLVIKNREDAETIFNSLRSQNTLALYGFRKVNIFSSAGAWSFEL